MTLAVSLHLPWLSLLLSNDHILGLLLYYRTMPNVVPGFTSTHYNVLRKKENVLITGFSVNVLRSTLAGLLYYLLIPGPVIVDGEWNGLMTTIQKTWALELGGVNFLQFPKRVKAEEA